MLCGLDLERKVRLLRLLRKQQREDRAAVLYLTVDFASAKLVGEDVAFMKEGAFVEGPGPGARMLDYPKGKDLREYVEESLRQEDMARGHHLRAYFARDDAPLPAH
jgi:ABC-type phosphonate transport system ATPase subunit